MDTKNLVKNYLEKEKQGLLGQLKQADECRQEAPTSTESRSDTTRARYEHLIETLKEKIRLLEKQLVQISQLGELKYFETNSDGKTQKYILVPDGVGGRKIGDIFLVSESTPVGQKLASQGEALRT